MTSTNRSAFCPTALYYGPLLQRSVTALLLHCHLPLCCSKSALLCLLSFCFTLSIIRFVNILLDFELRRSTLALLFGARALHRRPASVLWYNALLQCSATAHWCYNAIFRLSVTVCCFCALFRCSVLVVCYDANVLSVRNTNAIHQHRSCIPLCTLIIHRLVI